MVKMLFFFSYVHKEEWEGDHSASPVNKYFKVIDAMD